jgi:hypothetical protein
MWKRVVDVVLALVFIPAALTPLQASAAALTPLETRWMQAAWPVITYARAQGLPLDIVAQPVAEGGEPPIAMGYVDGRCKLVLTMRGNPEAESTLDKIPAELRDTVVEAMTAHELGHCWRYAQGAWHTPPVAGFTDALDTSNAPQADVERDMRATRWEEGFADLVGLAWTRTRHPERYRAVHDWFERFRADQPLPGAHHDTRAWLKRAKDPAVFGAAATPFEQALPVWRSEPDAGR